MLIVSQRQCMSTAVACETAAMFCVQACCHALPSLHLRACLSVAYHFLDVNRGDQVHFVQDKGFVSAQPSVKRAAEHAQVGCQVGPCVSIALYVHLYAW